MRSFLYYFNKKSLHILRKFIRYDILIKKEVSYEKIY